MNDLKKPLVSIVVATYNSSKYIIETLESIKEQTYKNIEVIISDDCSQDDTVNICKQWISENASLPQIIKLIESPINTGVPANFNRGITRANGIWIKSIAGDDIFKKNAIEEYVRFITDHKECRICMAKLEPFGISLEKCKHIELSLNKYYSILNCRNKKIQYQTALKQHILPGPGIFYQKLLWEQIGGFNERYTRAEEWPFEIKVTAITPIYLLDKKLVKWRQRSDSLSNNRESLTYLQNKEFYWDVRRHLIRKEFGYFAVLDFNLKYKYFQTENFVYKMLRVFSPYAYYTKIRKYIRNDIL